MRIAVRWLGVLAVLVGLAGCQKDSCTCIDEGPVEFQLDSAVMVDASHLGVRGHVAWGPCCEATVVEYRHYLVDARSGAGVLVEGPAWARSAEDVTTRDAIGVEGVFPETGTRVRVVLYARDLVTVERLKVGHVKLPTGEVPVLLDVKR